MKLIYSHLQKLLPDLQVEPQKLRDDLTMIGHFCNYFEEIDNEIVFDLDIKVNRGDCLGYYGIARDLATYYHLRLVTPEINLSTTNHQLPIQVTSTDVYRVMCLKISHLSVEPSPEWLSRFVKIHQVNSVNNIVDLTNYIMFLYGIPNHAFDVAKTGENIIWENNHGKTTDFTTLDGTVLKLTDENLVISNPTEVISSDFVGGQNSGTYDSTNEVIIEVAIYNPRRIRLDSRQHKTVTEAGIRLEKQLDCELVPQALTHLAHLITELGHGQVSSSIFDYYPNPIKLPVIKFDYSQPTALSGINIPADFSLNVLTRLGCQIDGSKITPPSIRPDITLPEDLTEEVVRFYGYNHIPINEPIISKQTPDITPKVLYLIEKLKDELVSQGYDEVITWPLVQKPLSEKAVYTQNSINSEYPVLRQSIIQSLENQLDQYTRYKLPAPKFFEIGKIYYQENGQYIEKYALGTYDGQEFKETILDDLDQPESYIPQNINNTAIELTSQIITLDANVTINGSPEPLELIKKYSALIDQNILWSMEIVDIFENKYTFRVHYYNCDDKVAKSVHLKTFNLV